METVIDLRKEKSTLLKKLSNASIEEGLSGSAAIAEVINIVGRFYEPYPNELRIRTLPKILFRGVTQIFKDDYCRDKNDQEVGFRIRSGATVRIKPEKDCEFVSYSSLVDYVKSLIDNARRNFPSSYTDKSDIEILADIQHKGGATCLVDFSKSLLTALWFACNKNSTEDGIVYCYDVYRDVFLNNRTNVLNKNESERSIENLLLETRKTSNLRGKYSYKFWLWQPACSNERIFRQDSIFIFGLEKFETQNLISYENKNNFQWPIKTIHIPGSLKKSICKTLDETFGVNAETIFHDVDGFANVNNKFDLLEVSKKPTYYNSMGQSHLLCGNYHLALDLFCQCKCNTLPSEKTNALSLEVDVPFSKAICYEKTEKKEAAILEYRKASERCFEAIEKYGDVIDVNIIGDLYLKGFRAYRKELDLLFDTQRFDEGCICCEKIKAEIDKYNIKPTTTSSYSHTYCNFVLVELFLLSYFLFDNKFDKNKYDILLKLNEPILKDNNFNSLLYIYFERVGESLANRDAEWYRIKEKYDKIKVSISNGIESKKIGHIRNYGIFEWDFGDLLAAYNREQENLLGSKTDDRHAVEKYNDLIRYTYQMIDISNVIENRYLMDSSEDMK